MRDVTRADVLTTLNTLGAKGKHDYVRKGRMWLAQLWDWAIEQDHTTENPPRPIRPERAFEKKYRWSVNRLRYRDVSTSSSLCSNGTFAAASLTQQVALRRFEP